MTIAVQGGAWIRPFAVLAALAGTFVLAGCGGGSGAPNNPYAPGPTIPAPLSILPPSATVYLAGSMHLLRPEDARLPAGFELAYRESERLVMEIDFDDLDPSAAAAFTTFAICPRASGFCPRSSSALPPSAMTIRITIPQGLRP